MQAKGACTPLFTLLAEPTAMDLTMRSQIDDLNGIPFLVFAVKLRRIISRIDSTLLPVPIAAK
jgi:hypothetical protein